ncbi:hypothetical protein PQ43W_30 [Ralstonia phage PQ43W]
MNEEIDPRLFGSQVAHGHIREAPQRKAEPGANMQMDGLEFRLRNAIQGIANCIADPMWEGHAEVSKTNLKRWHKLLHDLRATITQE